MNKLDNDIWHVGERGKFGNCGAMIYGHLRGRVLKLSDVVNIEERKHTFGTGKTATQIFYHLRGGETIRIPLLTHVQVLQLIEINAFNDAEVRFRVFNPIGKGGKKFVVEKVDESDQK